MIHSRLSAMFLAAVCLTAAVAHADSSDWEISSLGFVHSVELAMPGTLTEHDYVMHDAVMRFSELVMSEIRYQEQVGLKQEHQRQLSYFDEKQQAYERARQRRAWNLFALIFPFLFAKPEAPEKPTEAKSELFDETRFRAAQLKYLQNFIGVCPDDKAGYVYLRQRHIKTNCFADVESALTYFETYPHRLSTVFDRAAVHAAVLAVTGKPLVHTAVPTPAPVERVVAAESVARSTDASAVACEDRARAHIERLLVERGRDLLAFQLAVDMIDLVIDQLPGAGGTEYASIDGFFDTRFPGVSPQRREQVLDKLRQHDIAAGRDGSQTEGVFYNRADGTGDAADQELLNVQVLDRASEFERAVIAMAWLGATLDSERELRSELQPFDELAAHLQRILSRTLRADDPVFRRSLLQTARADARLELDTLMQGIRRDTAGLEKACLAALAGNPGPPSDPLPGISAMDYLFERIDAIDGGAPLQRRNPALGHSQ